MNIINILIILSLNIVIILSFYKSISKIKIGLICLLILLFIGLNIYLQSFSQPIIIFIILFFSSSIIIFNLFLKLSPINHKIENYETIKKVRILVSKIIFPILITSFQIVLMSDTKLQDEMLSQKSENIIKAIDN